jgi:4-hydroxy-3-polyprenylbenzoate decarboxylase
MPTQRRIVVGITGASGAVYVVRLLRELSIAPVELHLAISASGAAVIQQELRLTLNPRNPDLNALINVTMPWATQPPETYECPTDRWMVHAFDNFLAPIASGSFQTNAMVICPCSGSTLSGIARGASSNLIQRAAEVHLKERRRLVLVPRETPLSLMQIENMQRVVAAGGVLLPAMPGWYHGVTSLDCIVDFVVSRVLDQLEIDHPWMRRWGEA